MNDFERDELASAYIDDAVTAEERARVDADPALRARVDELRRVRDGLRESAVEPAADATREASIAAALAAAPVVDLGAARARRRVRVASIAAAAILLVGAGGLLLRSLSTASSTKSASTAAGSSSSSAAEALSAPTTSIVTNTLLSAYPNREALVASVTASTRFASQATSAAGTGADNAAPRATDDSSSTTRCAVAAPDSTASEFYRENAVLDGLPVQIDVFMLADGTKRLVVTSTGTCTLVFTQTL